MATNCFGPFLFFRYLEKILKNTARTSPAGTVRVVWTAALVSNFEVRGGIRFDDDKVPVIVRKGTNNYMATKVGNIFLSSEIAQALAKDKVISVVSFALTFQINTPCSFYESQCINPGMMKTNLWRDQLSKYEAFMMVSSRTFNVCDSF